MVLEWSRIDLLCCSVSLHLKGTWETQNHQTFCVSLVLVTFTLIYRAACPLLVKHSTITSEESLTDSKLPDTGYLRTKGQESVYETCACVIHTILLSYMCIKGARYLLIIHEVLVAMDFFSAGAQDEALEEESQRLAS